MAFWERTHEGYLMVDHRASPGIPAEHARRMGYDPTQVGEGKLFEAPTYGCPHCGGVVVMKPDRTRERAHCFLCHAKICDCCDAVRREPGYIHHTVARLADLVHSGRYSFTGSMGRPILRRTGA